VQRLSSPKIVVRNEGAVVSGVPQLSKREQALDPAADDEGVDLKHSSRQL